MLLVVGAALSRQHPGAARSATLFRVWRGPWQAPPNVTTGRAAASATKQFETTRVRYSDNKKPGRSGQAACGRFVEMSARPATPGPGSPVATQQTPFSVQKHDVGELRISECVLAMPDSGGFLFRLSDYRFPGKFFSALLFSTLLFSTLLGADRTCRNQQSCDYTIGFYGLYRLSVVVAIGDGQCRETPGAARHGVVLRVADRHRMGRRDL